jgi:hypothetical protein
MKAETVQLLDKGCGIPIPNFVIELKHLLSY